jgi:hypothetical protein
MRCGTVLVFDILGRPVRRLLDGDAPTDGRLYWHGDRDSGEGVASGVYFVRAATTVQQEVVKVILLK